MGNALISRILFQPPTPSNALNDYGESTNLKLTYLWIYNSSGVLIPALHVTHPPTSGSENTRYGSAGAGAGKYTLLYSHGNAEDLGLIAHFLTDLARLLGVDVLCYDYAGYGKSTDVVSVSCFLREYGQELEGWKRTKLMKMRDGEVSGEEETIFVAPMVYPQTLDGTGDEFDFVDDVENDGDDGNSSCLGSCDGRDQGQVYRNCEEEEDDGGFFANACGLGNYEPEADGQTLEGRLFHRSNIQRMEEARPLPKYYPNGSYDQFMSPKTKRRNLLARHSWTSPSPSEQQCYDNIKSAFEYLTQVKGVQPKNILMYGKSVGSGPTCWLAQKLCAESPHSIDVVSPVEGREEYNEGDGRRVASRTPGGVILHSPFLSVIRVVLDMGFTGIGDLFPNVDRVNDFTCPVYVIHGTQDEIVPFYHGESLFNILPDSSKTVPFWARGAGHNNIEMEMPTAYIKRLQQFIRQCDRILYPSAKSFSVTNQMLSAYQNQLVKNQVNGYIATRPGMKRYASQDSSNWAGNAQPNCHLCEHDQLVQEQKLINKQRKQKGTLVMKSSHNSSQQTSYSSPPTTSAELQQQQKQQLLVEQYRQLRMQRQAAAHEYLPQSQSSSSRSHYQRTNSVPVMMPQQPQVHGGVGGSGLMGLYGRE